MQDQELRAFRDSYARSFTSASLQALASLVAYPCQVVGDTSDAARPSIHVVPDRARLASRLQPVMQGYQQMEVARAEIAECSVMEVSPRLRWVRVRWRLGDGSDRPALAFCAAYTIAGAGRDLAIVAIAHDEIIRAREHRSS